MMTRKKSVKRTGAETAKLHLAFGTVERFFERSLERSRKMDAGVKVEPERVIYFADPEDLLQCLSAERLRLLRAVRKQPSSVTGLALALKRDRRAVARDVELLRGFGIVDVREAHNPGHGVCKMVQAGALSLQLSARI